MGRKSAAFRIIIHNREKINPKQLQGVFRDFYAGQVFARLKQSGLSPQGQSDVLERLIAQHK